MATYLPLFKWLAIKQNEMSAPRIIAGSARGLRLKSLPGKDTRPITDRVKENLFNIIRDFIPNSHFLDLFGGIGSVGIEALSRGASFCQFIENNPSAVRIIHENLSFTRLTQFSNVKQVDAFIFLKNQIEEKFDFIYIAPPQYKGLWEKALYLVDQLSGAIMSDSGWVIIQIDPVEETVMDLKNLVLFDHRRYGNTLLMFFRKRSPD